MVHGVNNPVLRLVCTHVSVKTHGRAARESLRQDVIQNCESTHLPKRLRLKAAKDSTTWIRACVWRKHDVRLSGNQFERPSAINIRKGRSDSWLEREGLKQRGLTPRCRRVEVAKLRTPAVLVFQRVTT